MNSDERWLAANWPFVRSHLPAAPARVVEIGCGPAGGFVPMLESAGYQATGIDPEAPAGSSYRQAEFESYEAPGPVSAIVASASLHHVADLAVVLDQVKALLVPDGRLVIVEWAHERFDEATARWCFARLPDPGEDQARLPEHGEDHARLPESGEGQARLPEHGEDHARLPESGEGHSWLVHRRAEWRESGQPWADYLRSWTQAEGLHTGEDILAALDPRFGAESVTYGPYFFADLAGTSEAEEQAAIDAGLIQANRIRYAGRPRLLPGPVTGPEQRDEVGDLVRGREVRRRIAQGTAVCDAPTGLVSHKPGWGMVRPQCLFWVASPFFHGGSVPGGRKGVEYSA